MGWSGGSRMVSNLIMSLRQNIPDRDLRKAVYLDIIRIFREEDCDTLDECKGEDDAYDSAYEIAYKRH